MSPRLLEAELGESDSTKLVWKPTTTTEMDLEAMEKLMKLVDALEDDDDVHGLTDEFRGLRRGDVATLGGHCGLRWHMKNPPSRIWGAVFFCRCVCVIDYLSQQADMLKKPPRAGLCLAGHRLLLCDRGKNALDVVPAVPVLLNHPRWPERLKILEFGCGGANSISASSFWLIFTSVFSTNMTCFLFRVSVTSVS